MKRKKKLCKLCDRKGKNMRLIDADELKKQEVLEKLRTAEFDDEIEDVIEKIPTAYDVNEVIKKMETYKSQQSENEMLSDNSKWLVKRVIEECIKIVKSGGVS